MSGKAGAAAEGRQDPLAVWADEGGAEKEAKKMESLKVLVLEDDAIIAMLLSEVLYSMGHLVCATASTEDDGVKAAARFHPDMIIADEQLGSGSGMAALQQILRTGPVRHLFVTGDGAKVRARLPQAVIIQKPFSQDELARAIAKTCCTASQ